MQRKYGNHFKGFFEGPDAFWALEDDISRSVNNVMALVDVTDCVRLHQDPAKVVLNALRKTATERVLSKSNEFPKLLYKRCIKHGFPFWTDENNLSVNDYIR